MKKKFSPNQSRKFEFQSKIDKRLLLSFQAFSPEYINGLRVAISKVWWWPLEKGGQSLQRIEERLSGIIYVPISPPGTRMHSPPVTHKFSITRHAIRAPWSTEFLHVPRGNETLDFRFLSKIANLTLASPPLIPLFFESSQISLKFYPTNI